MNLNHLHDILTAQLAALPLNTPFHTPDQRSRRRFTLYQRQHDVLTIQTQHGAHVRVPIDAFARTLIHLQRINSSAAAPCRIGSSNRDPLIGGLCAVARGADSRTRVINYVLPILEALHWVQVDGQRRPNTAWLNPSLTHATEGAQHA